jgi:predicted amidohydrolase YtcJ
VPQPGKPHADLVLRGGNVITLAGAAAGATAVAVEGERIALVGSDADATARIGPATRVVELAGRTLMPGLTDGHAHLDREGLKEVLPSMSGCRSIEALVERLARIAARTPPGQWIITMPLGEPPEYLVSESMFEEGRLPDRRDLDRASTRHPILIRCAWGYWPFRLPLVSVANSAALALAGIGRNTVPPSPLVRIDVDAGGEPTGIVRDGAYQPIAEFTLFRAAPHFSADDRVRTLGRSMQIYNACGTTAVFEGHGVAPEVVDAYRALRSRDRQTVRATLAFSPGWSGASGSDVAGWVAEHAKHLSGRGEGDEWLRLAGLYAEPETQPLESRLRADCAPRTGWAGFNYDCTLPPDKLLALLKAAAREKLRVCGIQMEMLELYEAAAREAPIHDLRWVIAHPITIDREQAARLAGLGIVVTTHTNAYLWKKASEILKRIGREKEEILCPIRSLLDAGVKVSLATDNVPVSMWPCIWQAVERIDRDTAAVLAPGQRISREEALQCATVNGAWLCMDEEERGTLEPGKLADMIVLDENPLNIEASRIQHIEPAMTIAGGRVAWERGSGILGTP